MARTSNATLLLMILGGLSAGLWLAARSGTGAAKTSGLEPAGSGSVSDAAPDGTGGTAALEKPELAKRERARPRVDASPLVPKPGETCLYGALELEDGGVPKQAGFALFALEDGHPRFPPVGTFAAGEGGSLRACAALEGEMEVVAFAPGFQPASRRVRAIDTPLNETAANETAANDPARNGAARNDAKRIDLQPFVLHPGVSVHGRVTAGDLPLVRAEVEARETAPGYEARVEGGELGWRAGQYTWCAARGETATDGTYTIAGLDPGLHVLRLCTVRQRDVAIDVQDVKTQRASLPGEPVDFALPAARLDLSFQSSGTPLCCVEVQVKAGDRFFMRRTDDAGRIGLLIQPELGYELTAARFGFATIRTQLRGLIDGEHRPETLALEPQSELATLIIADNQSTGTARATFELRPRIPVEDAHVDVRSDVARDEKTKKFVIPNVPAGSWRVTVHSGTDVLAGSNLTRNCDPDVLVQVPDHGTVETQVSVSERGGLRVFTRTQAGDAVNASLRLLDTHGNPIEGLAVLERPLPPPEVISDPEERRRALTSPPPVPYPAGQVVVYSGLCAGTADLVASAPGMEEAKTRVSIVMGEITPVNVVLRPK